MVTQRLLHRPDVLGILRPQHFLTAAHHLVEFGGRPFLGLEVKPVILQDRQFHDDLAVVTDDDVDIAKLLPADQSRGHRGGQRHPDAQPLAPGGEDRAQRAGDENHDRKAIALIPELVDLPVVPFQLVFEPVFEIFLARQIVETGVACRVIRIIVWGDGTAVVLEGKLTVQAVIDLALDLGQPFFQVTAAGLLLLQDGAEEVDLLLDLLRPGPGDQPVTVGEPLGGKSGQRGSQDRRCNEQRLCPQAQQRIGLCICVGLIELAEDREQRSQNAKDGDPAACEVMPGGALLRQGVELGDPCPGDIQDGYILGFFSFHDSCLRFLVQDYRV